MDIINAIPKTDQRLLDALQKSAEHKFTPEEIQQQRISFVYASLGHDSSLTKEQVKQHLKDQE